MEFTVRGPRPAEGPVGRDGSLSSPDVKAVGKVNVGCLEYQHLLPRKAGGLGASGPWGWLCLALIWVEGSDVLRRGHGGQHGHGRCLHGLWCRIPTAEPMPGSGWASRQRVWAVAALRHPASEHHRGLVYSPR